MPARCLALRVQAAVVKHRPNKIVAVSVLEVCRYCMFLLHSKVRCRRIFYFFPAYCFYPYGLGFHRGDFERCLLVFKLELCYDSPSLLLHSRACDSQLSALTYYHDNSFLKKDFMLVQNTHRECREREGIMGDVSWPQ